jgi:hypothetical protein
MWIAHVVLFDKLVMNIVKQEYNSVESSSIKDSGLAGHRCDLQSQAKKEMYMPIKRSPVLILLSITLTLQPFLACSPTAQTTPNLQGERCCIKGDQYAQR